MKFTQPVSMECSKEQYERDLKVSLLAMGYEETNNTYIGLADKYIGTNIGAEDYKVSDVYENSRHDYGRYFIDEYNPKLFLALAGMTDSETGNIGEWWKHIMCGTIGFTGGELYKQTKSNYQLRYAFLDDNFKENGNEGSNNKWFVKATQQEIIKHFSNKTMNKVTIKKSDFKKLHDLACSNWKTKLTNFIARDFLYSDTIDFNSDFVSDMRKACTPEQLVVFKEIFGDFEELFTNVKYKDRDWFGDNASMAHITPRTAGDYEDKGFYLSNALNWELKTDNLGSQVLVPTQKF